VTNEKVTRGIRTANFASVRVFSRGVNSGHRLATHDAEEARISGLDGPVGGRRWDPALVRLGPFTSPRDRQICQYPARRRSN
jgi:hypothetical protein